MIQSDLFSKCPENDLVHLSLKKVDKQLFLRKFLAETKPLKDLPLPGISTFIGDFETYNL